MQLLKLETANFRGLRDTVIDFGGKSAEIYGRNGTGKTTVANAVWWVLYGKALDGEKNFTPKTRVGEEDAHGLSHSAELTVKTGDGVVIALKKVFYEKYTKAKGAAEAVFDGHTTDYFIDDVPVKEKEYTARVSDIIGDPVRGKLLSSVSEFAGVLSWEDRRRILIEVCGDVTDADVIAANPDLAELPSILAMPGDSGRVYNIEEYTKIAKAKLTEIRREKDMIPARIDEADRAIKEIPANPPKDVDADLAAIDTLIMGVDNELIHARAATNDTAAAKLRIEIKNAEMEIATARTAHMQRGANANAETYKKLQELEKKIALLRTDKGLAEAERNSTERKIADMKARREELIKRDAEIRARVWDATKETCAMCGQTYPPEKIEELRGTFNKRKAHDLEQITAHGRRECSKDMIADLEVAREGFMAQAEAAERMIAELTAERDALKGNITDAVPFEDTEECKALSARLAGLVIREQEGENAAAQSNAELVSAISAKRNEMVIERNRLATIKQAIQSGEAQRARIAELKAQMKTLAIEDETLQRNIHICERFDTAKMEMLDGAINAKFTAVKFRMFVQQLNGGIRKDCEVLVPSKDGAAWVPYSGGSNRGANANAGLEIISVLSRHWGQRMPVLVDNSESQSSWDNMGLQVIRFFVSRTDDVLRVETNCPEKQ